MLDIVGLLQTEKNEFTRSERALTEIVLADVDSVLKMSIVDLALPHDIDPAVVDIADEAAVLAWADAVVADHGRANLVFNNAGVALSGTVASLSTEDYRWVMGVNFWGVVHGTKAFLPHLEASGDFPESIGEDLAVLVREDGGQLLLASVEQLAEREHHTLALRPRRTRPGGESRLRRLHRHVHIRRRSQPHLLRHRPDRRVVHRSGASGLTDESGAIDKVIENAHGSHGRGHAFAVRAMSHPLRILSAWTQQRP